VALTGEITLRYNTALFAIINTGEDAQNIAQLAFTGGSDEDAFSNSSNSLGDLITGQSCVLILLSGQNAPVPSEWGCAGVRNVTINTPAVFWRADNANDQTFTFELGQTVITCDTVGRAVGRLEEGECVVR
jgi:hypothetical protein